MFRDNNADINGYRTDVHHRPRHAFQNYRDTSLDAASREKKLEQVRRVWEEKRIQNRKQREQQRRLREDRRLAYMLANKLKIIRAQEVEELRLKKSKAAVFIQRVWRLYDSWQNDCFYALLQRAVILIQCTFRRYQSRVKCQWLLQVRRVKASLKLQCWYRMQIAIKTKNEMIAELAAKAVLIQRLFRGYEVRIFLWREKERFSAVIIQCFLRVLRARFRLRWLQFCYYEELYQEFESECMLVEEEMASITWAYNKLVIGVEEGILLEKNRERRAKEDLAKKHGIIVLPWRKQISSLSSLVLEQRKRNLLKKKKEKEQRAKEEEERLEKEKRMEMFLEKTKKIVKQSSIRKKKKQIVGEYELDDRHEGESKNTFCKFQEDLNLPNSDRFINNITITDELLLQRKSSLKIDRKRIIENIREYRSKEKILSDQKKEEEKKSEYERLKFMEKLKEMQRQSSEEFMKKFEIKQQSLKRQKSETLLRQLKTRKEQEEKIKRLEIEEKKKLRKMIIERKRVQEEREREIQKQMAQEEAKRVEEGRRKAKALRESILSRLRQEAKQKSMHGIPPYFKTSRSVKTVESTGKRETRSER